MNQYILTDNTHLKSISKENFRSSSVFAEGVWNYKFLFYLLLLFVLVSGLIWLIYSFWCKLTKIEEKIEEIEK